MFEEEAEEKGDEYIPLKQQNVYARFQRRGYKDGYQQGAEYGYNKKCEETFEMALSQIKHDRAVVIEENERLHAKNADLEAQIEKMKCCENCIGTCNSDDMARFCKDNKYKLWEIGN